MCDPASAALAVGGTFLQNQAQQDALDQQRAITSAAQARQLAAEQQRQNVLMTETNKQQSDPLAANNAAADALTKSNQAAVGDPLMLGNGGMGADSARFTTARADRAKSTLAEGMRTAALQAKMDAVGKVGTDNAMGMNDANVNMGVIAGNAQRDMGVAQMQASAVQPDPLLSLLGGAMGAAGGAMGKKSASAAGAKAAMGG